MHKRFLNAGLAFCVASVCHNAHATGFWMPTTVLEDGARQVLGTPEFFWELECKRIAKEFTVPEKRIAVPQPTQGDYVPEEELRAAFTAKVDADEFAAAVKAGAVTVPNADQAVAQHRAAREALLKANESTTEPLPAEAPGEFADYHLAAYAFKTGKLDAAKAGWAKLLERPAAERKHRSTWASYMLGRLAIQGQKYEEALPHFQQTRQLAKDGFADTLGLAAESYGWEARCELERGAPNRAAQLYLAQLALGDVSAVASLKLLVADRGDSLEGQISDAPLDESAAKIFGTASVHEALTKAAADPILRRLVTAHVLAVGVSTDYTDNGEKPNPGRQKRWLAAIEKAGIKTTADAEHLGWVAYSAGSYGDAARWLKLSSGDSCAALWLKGKLALRDGKLKDSATFLAEAVRALPSNEQLENSLLVGDEMMPGMAARGDLGTVQLARAEFIQALDTFLATDLWDDAAYVAERCLTTKELLDYTQQHFPTAPKELTDAESERLTSEELHAREAIDRFRNMVARRLVREDDYAGAKPYFGTAMQKRLDDYTAALAKAQDEKTGKRERARAFFQAAWIARHDGMELMGTEGGPDAASVEGSFNLGDLAMVRLTGKFHAVQDAEDGDEPKPKHVSFALPVSAEEKKRLGTTRVNPELRYHYRHVAAGLAWKAAELLPDGAEETADVLNTAGNWLKTKHEKAADRFIQAIERRCSKTTIGKAALASHWFVDLDGPWSTEETARDKAEGRTRE